MRRAQAVVRPEIDDSPARHDETGSHSPSTLYTIPEPVGNTEVSCLDIALART